MLAEIAAFLEGEESPAAVVQDELSLTTIADKTGFDLDTLERWVRAVRRGARARRSSTARRAPARLSSPSFWPGT